MRSGEINKDGASEKRVMDWIHAQLRARYPEGLWERQNVVGADMGDRFVKAGTKGQADLRGLYRGKYFELEVKKPGEVQTENQIKRQKVITDAGGFYAVVHNPREAFAVVDGVIG